MTEYIDIIVQKFIKIQSRFYHQLSMDFEQYFKKFIDSHNKQLIWEEFDIISKYHEQFYSNLRVGDQLKEFAMIKGSTGKI